jgi:hypothetical protein
LNPLSKKQISNKQRSGKLCFDNLKVTNKSEIYMKGSSGAGFSLRGLGLARTKIRRLKPAPLEFNF